MQTPARLQQNFFTLIEMLVVLSIVGVVMGIIATGVNFTSNVDAGARMLSGSVYLARQHAISKRKLVAVLLPDSDDLAGFDGAEQYREVSMRPCLVTKGGTASGEYIFDSHINNSQWNFLPQELLISQPGGSNVDTCVGKSYKP